MGAKCLDEVPATALACPITPWQAIAVLCRVVVQALPQVRYPSAVVL